MATLLFYLFLGVFPMLSARNNIRGTKEYSLYDWLWLLVWSVAGTFRVIQRTGVGGSDTYGYVRYFENCNNEHLNSIYVHIADDWLYKVINQALNAVCADYHFFLFAVYAFETWCFILFYKKFCSQGNNVLPYLLTPFLYVRSLTTIRSNLAICFVLLAMVLQVRRKNVWAIVVASMSVLVHKFTIVYVPFFILFPVLGHINFSRKSIILFFGISSGVILLLKQLLLAYVKMFSFEGAYLSYISNSSSFLETWGIAFEQLALGVFLLCMYNTVQWYLHSGEEEENRMSRILYYGCVYDVLLVPICGALGIWRGYEVMYLPRIVMWGILLYLCQMKMLQGARNLFNVAVLTVLGAWLVYRYVRTWKSSNLMPYIFEFFQF